MPVSIFDIAKAFLTKESMTHQKLQTLCYYVYVWYLVLTGERLTDCSFQAWIQGPVCPELYYEYKKYRWR